MDPVRRVSRLGASVETIPPRRVKHLPRLLGQRVGKMNTEKTGLSTSLFLLLGPKHVIWIFIKALQTIVIAAEGQERHNPRF